MSRLVALGPAVQNIFLVDRDDFAELPLDDKSVFGKLAIGSKIDIDKAVFSVGGSGANAAVAFARAGHEVIFLGTLAHDSAGEAVLRTFDEENIDSSYVSYARGSTGCSVMLIDAKSSQRTVLEYRGVSERLARLDPRDLDNIHPDWLYVSTLGGDLEQLGAFLASAKAVGAKTMFSPGPAELAKPKELLRLLPGADILILNREEASLLVSGVLLSELLERLGKYCSTVIITDGIMGAIATDGQDTYRLGVYEQTHVRDFTGAGDAFGASFLAAFASGWKFRRALHFAAANASRVTATYGAQAGLLSLDIDLHPMPISKINADKAVP